jgi:soluble lytic murein transglycosylase-like protein
VLGDEPFGSPRVNLLAGGLYLAQCARCLHSDLADADRVALLLAAYNIGPRAAAEWRDSGICLRRTDGGARVESALPPETVEHSVRILAALKAMRL